MIARIIHDMHICQCIMLHLKMFLTRTFDSFQPALEPFPQAVVIEAAWHTAAQFHNTRYFVFVLSCDTNSMLQQGCSYEKLNGEYRSACWKDQVCCNHLQPISYVFSPFLWFRIMPKPSRGRQTNNGLAMSIAWPVYTLMSETGFCTTEWNSLNGVLCFQQITSTKSANSWRPSYCKPSSSKSMFEPQLPSIDKVHRITWWNWPFSTCELCSMCCH